MVCYGPRSDRVVEGIHARVDNHLSQPPAEILERLPFLVSRRFGGWDRIHVILCADSGPFVWSMLAVARFRNRRRNRFARRDCRDGDKLPAVRQFERLAKTGRMDS
jgi:hypothetical protein